MYRIKDREFEIEEIKREEPLDHVTDHVAVRPEIVNAKVYKLRSGFVKHSVYITLGYITQGGRNRPIEIFINSKDLTKNAEYAVLTRLISAIFRKSNNPVFILEELSSIHDPNGGYHKNGKYIHSFYSEIADVIEQFFKEIGCMEQPEEATLAPEVKEALDSASPDTNIKYQICPECGQRSVKMENGCLTCINPECGYSKCDK
ncbi:MAG: hypothetical protein JXR46_09440 [Calditrichaceae bacterium]|nr:hypothetical protein [Calditrichaceae bacterium]MBN2709255.1 hypothetical protein [Calditrichaceae bacterium]RQV96208.1 MAG: hypothetical protein EH224_05750 [Calditrichota bacterium]